MEKHLHSGHPAVGLLDCVTGNNGKSYRDQGTSPLHPASICGNCGFDEAWHKLSPGDYTGPKPRPGTWAELLAAVDKDQAEAEAD